MKARPCQTDYAASVRWIMPLADTRGSEGLASNRRHEAACIAWMGMEGQRLCVPSDSACIIVWTVSERSGMARRAGDGKSLELSSHITR